MKEKILKKDFVAAPDSHVTHFHIEAFDGEIDLLASPRAASKLTTSNLRKQPTNPRTKAMVEKKGQN